MRRVRLIEDRTGRETTFAPKIEIPNVYFNSENMSIYILMYGSGQTDDPSLYLAHECLEYNDVNNSVSAFGN